MMKMKKIIIKALAAAIISSLIIIPAYSIILLANAQTDEDSNTTYTNNFKTYDSPLYGISIQYPSDWINDDDTENRFTPDNRVGFDIIVEFCPSSYASSSGIGRCLASSHYTFSVDVSHLPAGTSLNEFTTERILTHKLVDFTGFKIIESNSNITVSDNPAYKVVYRIKPPDGDYLKKMEIWTIKNDKAYILEYTSKATGYLNNLPVVQKMIDSFKINQMPPCHLVKDPGSFGLQHCEL